jgi:tetratricopeptide (TPR) repeat protein
MTTEEALALAQQCQQTGQLPRAAELYRQVLQAEPAHIAALGPLGAVYRRLGRLDEAVACYQEVVRIEPASPEAHYQLAVIRHQQGRLAEAAASYAQALHLRPDHAEAYNNRGVALKALGRLDEAIQSYEQAIGLRPAYPEAHGNLANALQERGERERAVACYCEALRLNPTSAVSHYNLGIALMALDRAPEAEASLRQALALAPQFAEAWNNLGIVLQGAGRLEEAVPCYREAVRFRPDFAAARYNLANCLRDEGRVADAVAEYQEALRLQPDYPEAHNNLANALQEQGDVEAAHRHCVEALRLKPACAAALFTLAELAGHARYPTPDDLTARIRETIADPQLPPADSSLLSFALGNLLDRAGEYDEAFTAFREGNEGQLRLIRASGRAFDADMHRRLIDRLVAVIDRPYFERVRLFGLETDVPVFIVGMPRSGTTLVEQILSQHPQVFGAGELREMGRAVDKLAARLDPAAGYPDCVTRLDRETARAAAEWYAGRLAARAGPARRVTDKMPQNFLHLGLIATLFPRARVIHCRRDARDVCLSCYFQNFRELHFSWSLEDLGRYYRGYERLMTHWHRVLPLQVLDLTYEEIVTRQEAVSRDLIAFCGLDWDPRCLDFPSSRRPVQTVSKLQVRRPMYTSSVGRWRRYERHLGPLLQALQEAVRGPQADEQCGRP